MTDASEPTNASSASSPDAARRARGRHGHPGPRAGAQREEPRRRVPARGEHPERLRPRLLPGRAHRHHRTERRGQVDAPQGPVRPGVHPRGLGDPAGRGHHQPQGEQARAGGVVGFVPQTNNVFPSLSIEENLQMGLYLRPRKFAERLEVIYDLFPVLGQRKGQRAGSLSAANGSRSRWPGALMMDPKVQLLDEPSAGLSPVRQDETFIRTRRINKAGVDRHGGAERATLSADLRSWVRARPGEERVLGHREGARRRPEGHRAVPGDARQGRRLRALSERCRPWVPLWGRYPHRVGSCVDAQRRTAPLLTGIGARRAARLSRLVSPVRHAIDQEARPTPVGSLPSDACGPPAPSCSTPSCGWSSPCSSSGRRCS